MITNEKLKIYKKYFGSADSWARLGKKREHELMSDNDWLLIDELLQELDLIEEGLVSEGYKTRIMVKFNEVCSDPTVRNELQNLVGRY